MSAPVLIGFESIQQIADEFSTGMLDEGTPLRVLLAVYECSQYEGEAFVLLEDEGQLLEVNGAHCSCYSLEGQFDLEPTSVEELRHRMEKGRLGVMGCGGESFAEKLSEVLAAWESKQ